MSYSEKDLILARREGFAAAYSDAVRCGVITEARAKELAAKKYPLPEDSIDNDGAGEAGGLLNTDYNNKRAYLGDLLATTPEIFGLSPSPWPRDPRANTESSPETLAVCDSPCFGNAVECMERGCVLLRSGQKL